MIHVVDAVSMKFEDIDIDPFWNIGNEPEHKSHRIHSYPAKFPAFITQKAIQYARNCDIDLHCISDIFCGCGTVAYETKRLGIDFWGCDLNPTAVLIAKTKSGQYQEQKVEKYYTQILEAFDNAIYDVSKEKPTPERIHYWFNQPEIDKLNLLKVCIQNTIPKKSKYMNYFLCAFSNILKPTSKWLTKSIKPQIDPHKQPAQIRQAFIDQCMQMRTALLGNNNTLQSSRTTIECRNVLTIKKKAFADLIITSPPYVTSYEYADLHQLSTLWLEYADDYRILRKNSIGSTHRDFNIKSIEQLNTSGKRIYSSLVKIDKQKAQSVARYFADMQKTVGICKNAIVPGGIVLMVIGNTEYKGIHIDNVKHLAESMQHCGFSQVSVTKRRISRKILTPYRDDNGRFSSSSEKRQVYSEEFIVIGR
jgi:hypothetical protein